MLLNHSFSHLNHSVMVHLKWNWNVLVWIPCYCNSTAPLFIPFRVAFESSSFWCHLFKCHRKSFSSPCWALHATRLCHFCSSIVEIRLFSVAKILFTNWLRDASRILMCVHSFCCPQWHHNQNFFWQILLDTGGGYWSIHPWSASWKQREFFPSDVGRFLRKIRLALHFKEILTSDLWVNTPNNQTLWIVASASLNLDHKMAVRNKNVGFTMFVS